MNKIQKANGKSAKDNDSKILCRFSNLWELFFEVIPVSDALIFNIFFVILICSC